MAKEDDKKKPEEEEERDEELDEEEGDDEEDEDEGDDEVAEARPPHSHAPPPPPPPAVSDEDPTWWVPHAVLTTLVLVGVLGFFGAFNTWLKPLFGPPTAFGAAASASAQAAAPVAPTPQPQPRPQTPPAQAEQGPVELFGAKHLIVQYKGSTRAPATVTRTKEEAKARTDEALKKLKGGAKWEDIVGEYSDEPGAAKRAGNLGNFRKGSMDKRFQAAVEALKVDQMSEVVESDFGFHIIVRTR